MNDFHLQFSLWRLLVWMSLFAVLAAILVGAGYRPISIAVATISLAGMLLLHEYMRKVNKIRDTWDYVAAYTLFLAASIGIAYGSIAVIGKSAYPKGEDLGGFIANTVVLAVVSCFFIGLFLLVSIAIYFASDNGKNEVDKEPK